MPLHREVSCVRRSHWRRAAVQVAATFGLLGFVGYVLSVPPRHTFFCNLSDAEQTRIKVMKYAFEAFPSWAASHPAEACPRALADLSEYMNDDDRTDSWGHPIRMQCDGPLPAGAKHIAIVSAGADGVWGTCDDLKSWNPKHACGD